MADAEPQDAYMHFTPHDRIYVAIEDIDTTWDILSNHPIGGQQDTQPERADGDSIVFATGFEVIEPRDGEIRLEAPNGIMDIGYLDAGVIEG